MDLKKALEEELSKVHQAGYRFIQFGALQRLITKESVQNYLRSSGINHTIENTDRTVSESPMLFAILVLCDQGHTIQRYLPHGFCDFRVRGLHMVCASNISLLCQQAFGKRHREGPRWHMSVF